MDPVQSTVTPWELLRRIPKVQNGLRLSLSGQMPALYLLLFAPARERLPDRLGKERTVSYDGAEPRRISRFKAISANRNIRGYFGGIKGKETGRTSDSPRCDRRANN